MFRRSNLTLALLIIAARAASADTPTILANQLGNLCGDASLAGVMAPRLAMLGPDVFVAPQDIDDGRPGPNRDYCFKREVVVAQSADKQAAWIAGDIGIDDSACGSVHCAKEPPLIVKFHGTVVVEKAGTEWRYVAWMFGAPTTGKEQAAALTKGVMPRPIARSVEAGAEDAVEVFESTVGVPNAFAASVSKRKDVVLYGSELAERTVGGARVAAKLAAWKLAFKVRDGVAAGVTASKTLAWVAANLDATSATKPGTPTPYRALLLYEKTGATWQLVHAQFTFVK